MACPTELLVKTLFMSPRRADWNAKSNACDKWERWEGKGIHILSKLTCAGVEGDYTYFQILKCGFRADLI